MKGNACLHAMTSPLTTSRIEGRKGEIWGRRWSCAWSFDFCAISVVICLSLVILWFFNA